MLTEVLRMFGGGPVTVAGLAKSLGISPEDADERVERLVRMGFLDELKDEDARGKGCRGCGCCSSACSNQVRSFRLTAKGARVI